MDDEKAIPLKCSIEKDGTVTCNLTKEEFKEIHKIREVERAMRKVPEKVKEIKETAINTVFAKEISGLDQDSMDVLEKVLGYMEKKYISVPMMMAKEIMLNNNSSQK